jgi:hypothetical protein
MADAISDEELLPLVDAFYKTAVQKIKSDDALGTNFNAVAAPEEMEESMILTARIATDIGNALIQATSSKNPEAILARAIQDTAPQAYRLGNIMAEIILRLDPEDQNKFRDIIPSSNRNASYNSAFAARGAPSLAKLFSPASP